MTDVGSPTDPEILAVRNIDDGVELDLAVPETHSCFEGHFPGFPILPGVAQIDWAALLADRYLETALGGARRFRVKFTSVIPPGNQLTLSLRRTKSGRGLAFEYRSGDRLMSSGSFDLDDRA